MQFPIDRFKDISTPFYYYDLSLLRATLEIINENSDYPGFHVHYAVKANSNPELMRIISSYGLGADVVSGGEIERAIECGFDPAEIVYAGVGKTDKEIRYALEKGVGCLNVESLEELEVISALAEDCGIKAKVSLRVNPEIDAHTHHYITTGLAEDKFGIDKSRILEIARRCVADPWIEFRGLHCHIGSQITIEDPFVALCERINDFQRQFEAAGIAIPIINVGGGLGIDYENPDENPIPDFQKYFNTFRDNLDLREGQELHFELGRSITGQCGSLICRTLFIKNGVNKKFLIVDGGMTDLIRPALYQAHHKIENISSDSTEKAMYDVVGPICESSDVFGTAELLPITRRGDFIALRSAGAYGEVMSSRYNCRQLPGCVLG